MRQRRDLHVPKHDQSKYQHNDKSYGALYIVGMQVLRILAHLSPPHSKIKL